MRNLLRSLFAAAALAIAAAPAIADDATPTLPGGANAISEVHDDWTVRCGVAQNGAAGAKSTCGISQQQLDNKTKRRVLLLGLAAGDNGGVQGSLVLPFGLLLDAGVTFQIDDGPRTATASHFRTCLPVGCVVVIDWPASTVTALRSAKKLTVAAQGENSQPATFTVSMKGFGSALDRAIALPK